MTSRRELYAHGEPFGDSATRRKLGGGYICGGGGGSESSSTQATTNIDRRLAVQDGIGISGDSNALSLTTYTTTNVLDGGAIKAAFDFSKATSTDALRTTENTFSRALDSIDASNATLGQGYELLLGAADKLFDRGESLIGQTQQAVADAYVRAQDTAKGTIDNRTIIVLAVAGAAAAIIATRGRK